MDFFIHTKGIDVSSDVRAEVNERLEAAVHRFSHEVSRVHTTLENVNGPKGGRDKRCVVTVTLSHGGSPIVCSARHVHIEGAVAQTARRLTRLLASRSDKFVTGHHSSATVSALSE